MKSLTEEDTDYLIIKGKGCNLVQRKGNYTCIECYYYNVENNICDLIKGINVLDSQSYNCIKNKLKLKKLKEILQ